MLASLVVVTMGLVQMPATLEEGAKTPPTQACIKAGAPAEKKREQPKRHERRPPEWALFVPGKPLYEDEEEGPDDGKKKPDFGRVSPPKRIAKLPMPWRTPRCS